MRGGSGWAQRQGTHMGRVRAREAGAGAAGGRTQAGACMHTCGCRRAVSTTQAGCQVDSGRRAPPWPARGSTDLHAGGAPGAKARAAAGAGAARCGPGHPAAPAGRTEGLPGSFRPCRKCRERLAWAGSTTYPQSPEGAAPEDRAGAWVQGATLAAPPALGCTPRRRQPRGGTRPPLGGGGPALCRAPGQA